MVMGLRHLEGVRWDSSVHCRMQAVVGGEVEEGRLVLLTQQDIGLNAVWLRGFGDGEFGKLGQFSLHVFVTNYILK